MKGPTLEVKKLDLVQMLLRLKPFYYQGAGVQILGSTMENQDPIFSVLKGRIGSPSSNCGKLGFLVQVAWRLRPRGSNQRVRRSNPGKY